jgi:NAD(P)-dependent dehydrogenase (short-subunit alcohol dehydrogenase family)
MSHAAFLPAGWQPAPDLLRDRIILLTGAANGIGRALADALAAHGATLVLLDRDVHGLEAAYDAIVAAGHPEPALYPMDLSGAGPDDYDALATTLEREFGRLDGLVHNAAELGALIPLSHFETELGYRTLQTDLNAPCLLTLACLDLLNASRDASVVFTSDAVGRHGKAYWGAYGVAKAGLECFMQILADELETNTPIRANSIDPGPGRERRGPEQAGGRGETFPLSGQCAQQGHHRTATERGGRRGRVNRPPAAVRPPPTTRPAGCRPRCGVRTR